jgi:DNA-binding transcriptional LysR family regulator
MALTQEGQALLRYCQGARDLEGEALAQIQKAGKVSQIRLRISGPTSIMRSRVIPSCIPTLRDWRNLLVEFHISDDPNLSLTLKSAKSQLAIIPPKDVAKEMESKVLRPEQYVLVGCARWKKRPVIEIVEKERIIDFDPSDQMSFSYLKKFDLLDRAQKDRYFANSTEAICEMFCQGLGYGVLTAEFAEPWIERGDLVALNGGRHLENNLALAWYPRPQKVGYFDAVTKVIR